MASPLTTGTKGTAPETDVTSPQPVPQVDTAPSLSAKKGPAQWALKLRPQLTTTPTHEDRLKQLSFDAFFAGAKSAGRWEDDWPLMEQSEFVKALQDVGSLEMGGHHPDGSHPRAPKKNKE